MNRDSMIFRAFSTFGENLVHVIVGLFFMVGGAALVLWAIQHPTIVVTNGVSAQQYSKWFIGGGAGVSLLGALFMPTILPMFKQIVVIVTPFIPLVGGKRAGDPPAPPSTPDRG